VNTDPTVTMVAFEIRGHDKPYVSSGPTRADDAIRQAWEATPVKHRREAARVTRVYSEWQPSAVDVEFIRTTFPAAALTYTHLRPAADGWDAALAAAGDEYAKHEAMQRAASMTHVAETGELVPILWSQTSPRIGSLQVLPHFELVPGRLYVAVATVALTPSGSIGMNHLATGGLDGRSFDDVFRTACDSLARGLSIDGRTDEQRPDKGQFLTLRRAASFASSAVALPGFAERMLSILGGERLIVGLPEPDSLLVARADSPWASDVRAAVASSTCPSSELVPCVLEMDTSGARMVAERGMPT
jgi:hypothetical protein